MALKSVERDARKRECETCGAPFTASPEKAGRFCRMACYRAWQRSPGFVPARASQRRASCAHCDADVLGRSASKCRDGSVSDKVFCDRDCYNEFRTLGAASRAKTTARPCRHCGEPVSAMSVTHDPKYCNAACRNAHVRPDSRHCSVCGVWFTPYYITPSGRVQVRDSMKTCSKACVRRLFRENKARKAKISAAFRGEKHPNWQGGPASGTGRGYRGPGWVALTKRIRERDGHACRHCGAPEEEGGRAHEVHHVRPFNQFNGDNTKANRPDNLLTLCRSCHQKAEWQWRRDNAVQMTMGLHEDPSSPPKPRLPSDLTGLVIGDMTIVESAPKAGANVQRWRCTCNVCGGVRLIWRPCFLAERGVWCHGTRAARGAAARTESTKVAAGD